MPEVHLPNSFTPRPYQRKFMGYLDHHANGGRAVWVVHRRGGKDLTAMHQTCKMMHERRGTYWHIFPTGEQARRSIWTEFTKDGDRIMEQVFPASIRKTPREWSPGAEMVVELKCGSIWRLMGSDKIEVAGAGPVGVVFSEYALAKPKTWDFVRPMIREREGWAAFVSTPRGKNHLWQRWEEAGKLSGWWRDRQTLFDTRAYDPERTVEEERAAGMPEALVRQEYLCDWTAANVGAVWGDLLEVLEKAGAVAEFEFDRQRVFTTWDLGGSGARGDATAFWIWAPTENGADLLDYYENHGKTLEHYFDEVDKRCGAIGARPVKHWLPHDARAKHLTGVSVLEQCAEHWGMEHVAIYPEEGLLNGIQAGRWLLQRAVRVHPRCSEGLEAIKAYHYGWDEDRKVFTNQPEHDWSSHGADAFRGVALAVKQTELLTRKPPGPKLGPSGVPSLATVTLDEMFAARERERR